MQATMMDPPDGWPLFPDMHPQSARYRSARSHRASQLSDGPHPGHGRTASLREYGQPAWLESESPSVHGAWAAPPQHPNRGEGTSHTAWHGPSQRHPAQWDGPEGPWSSPPAAWQRGAPATQAWLQQLPPPSASPPSTCRACCRYLGPCEAHSGLQNPAARGPRSRAASCPVGRQTEWREGAGVGDEVHRQAKHGASADWTLPPHKLARHCLSLGPRSSLGDSGCLPDYQDCWSAAQLPPPAHGHRRPHHPATYSSSPSVAHDSGWCSSPPRAPGSSRTPQEAERQRPASRASVHGPAAAQAASPDTVSPPPAMPSPGPGAGTGPGSPSEDILLQAQRRHGLCGRRSNRSKKHATRLQFLALVLRTTRIGTPAAPNTTPSYQLLPPFRRIQGEDSDSLRGHFNSEQQAAGETISNATAQAWFKAILLDSAAFAREEAD